MDSLLANYASASDSEEEEKGTEVNPSQRASLFSLPPPLPKRESNSSSSPSIFTGLPPPMNNNSSLPKGEYNSSSASSIFTALPPPKNNNSFLPKGESISSSSSSIFTALPPPKNNNSYLSSPSPSLKPQQDDVPKASSSSLFSSLPPVKSRSGFSLPAPKNKSGKRVVEFKPPLNPALLEKPDDEEKNERASKKRATSGDSEAPAGGLTALLPPPKNDNILGAGGAHTGRRFFLDTAPSTHQSPSTIDTDIREEPSLDVHHSVHSYSDGAITPSQNDYYYPAVPLSQGADFGYSGEAAWSYGNHQPQPWPPQEAAYVEINEPMEVAQQVWEGTGSSFGKADEKKRGRNQIPSNVIEVKQDELISNRPREDQAKLTGIAFGPSYQPVSSGKDKPTKLHKRKHQIGSLYFDLKQREMELAERRAKGQLTKAETQAKYGW